MPHTTSKCAGRLPLPPEQVDGSPFPMSSAGISVFNCNPQGEIDDALAGMLSSGCFLLPKHPIP